MINSELTKKELMDLLDAVEIYLISVNERKGVNLESIKQDYENLKYKSTAQLKRLAKNKSVLCSLMIVAIGVLLESAEVFRVFLYKSLIAFGNSDKLNIVLINMIPLQKASKKSNSELV